MTKDRLIALRSLALAYWAHSQEAARLRAAGAGVERLRVVAVRRRETERLILGALALGGVEASYVAVDARGLLAGTGCGVAEWSWAELASGSSDV